MSHIYVAASWREIERAKDAAWWLRDAGFEVWALWEAHPTPLGPALEEWEALADGEPNAGRTGPYLRLYHAKLECLLAIREADCLVLVEPAGNDTHYEAGFALAQDVPVVRFGRGRPGLMIFDAPVPWASSVPAMVSEAAALTETVVPAAIVTVTPGSIVVATSISCVPVQVVFVVMWPAVPPLEPEPEPLPDPLPGPGSTGADASPTTQATRGRDRTSASAFIMSPL